MLSLPYCLLSPPPLFQLNLTPCVPTTVGPSIIPQSVQEGVGHEPCLVRVEMAAAASCPQASQSLLSFEEKDILILCTLGKDEGFAAVCKLKTCSDDNLDISVAKG